MERWMLAAGDRAAPNIRVISERRPSAVEDPWKPALAIYLLSIVTALSQTTLFALTSPYFWLSFLPLGVYVFIRPPEPLRRNKHARIPTNFDRWLVAGQLILLGWILGASLRVVLFDGRASSLLFALELGVLANFHALEFLVTLICNPRFCFAVDTFLLNHSTAYWIAAFAGWLEFVVEAFFVPSLKSNSLVFWLGVTMCISGELIRKKAMHDAGEGFTHCLAEFHRPQHRLCTTGVYAWCRHPGYAGWMLFSLGTQITLANPICTLVYALVVWDFFRDRIDVEERDLLRWFGKEYQDYRHSVSFSGIPFAQGYTLVEHNVG